MSEHKKSFSELLLGCFAFLGASLRSAIAAPNLGCAPWSPRGRIDRPELWRIIFEGNSAS